VQQLRYALRFIREIFALANKNAALQKPWISLWAGSLVIVLLGLLPLVLIISLIGLQPIGLVLIGLIVILIYFCLVVWAQISMLSTCWVLDSLIQGQQVDDLPGEQPKGGTQRLEDGALLAAVSPGLQAIQLGRMVIHPNRVGDLQWMEHHRLALPVIAIEDLPLKQALSRIKQMVEENHVKVRPNLIPVNLFGRFVQWVLLLIGILIGFTVGLNIADPLTTKPLIANLGMGIGLLIACIFAIAGNHFSSFTRACYHTALYAWARNLEDAVNTGKSDKATTPMILSMVFRRSTKIKER
jgi:hypothetical protein